MLRWSDTVPHLHDLVGGGPPQALDAHSGRRWVSAFAFDPAEKRLASTDVGAVHVWETAPRVTLMYTMREHAGALTSIALSPDGRYLACGGYDGTIRVWEIPTEEQFAEGQAQLLTAPADAIAFVKPLLEQGLAPEAITDRVRQDVSLSKAARREAILYLIRYDLLSGQDDVG